MQAERDILAKATAWFAGKSGVTVSRQRMAYLMRRAGLQGVSRRRAYVVTTRRDERQRPAPDLVQRRFQVGFSRCVVGGGHNLCSHVGWIHLSGRGHRRMESPRSRWSIGEQMNTDLVLGALNMALQQRRPEEIIHHSDQGSQCTSLAFGNRCRQMRVRPSMGTVGDAFDNAMAESFFASLECELIVARPSKPVPRPAWQCSPGSKLAQPQAAPQRAGISLTC